MIRRTPRLPASGRWLGLLAALAIVAAVASLAGLLWRADLAIYDAALPSQPAPDDVVIVAIDDASLAELGPWPWRRAVHAALLDRLRGYGVRAVALNIMFANRDPVAPAGDVALADAMRRGPPTVLPMIAEASPRPRAARDLEPVDPLTGAAAGVGHAHVEIDPDGIVRRVYLREGIGTAAWPHLAAVLLAALPDGRAAQAGCNLSSPAPAAAGGGWERRCPMLIPYIGPPGRFVRVSYADVLRGSVDPAVLSDRLVLVGITAQGLETAYPTPRSGGNVGMPGVELAANVLQGLRSGRANQAVPPLLAAVFSVLPVLLGGLALRRSSPRRALLWVGAVWLLTGAASVVALRGFGWWWPPAAVLATLVLMYPLWSWSRLEAAQQYLDRELSRLADLPVPLPGTTVPSEAPFRGDPIERRIGMAQEATQRLRDLHRLYVDTIDTLPDAMVLTDVEGRILLANPAAALLFGADGPGSLAGRHLDEQLFTATRAEALRAVALTANAPCTVESKLRPPNRHVLVRAAPFFGHDRARLGTILGLVDISEVRAMQSEREDLLRFLSHDMKSPATSLLGLAQMQRDPSRALAPPELSGRLDLLAQRMLALVDSFVALARAESVDPHSFDEIDLCDVAQDAHDEVWAAASARAVAIDVDVTAAPLLVRGDRSLLARAITNLLGNAVKFAPAGSTVTVACRQDGDEAVVRVADRGPGIEPARAGTLFSSFARRLHRGGGDPGGAGLGLAFVRAVADKHGGRVWYNAGIEGGAVFSIAVPLHERAAD